MIVIVSAFLIVSFEILGLGAVASFLGGLLILILFLANLKLGLLSVVFFAPFERIPSLELFGVSLRINHLLVPILAFAWLLSSLAGKKLIIRKDPSYLFFGLMILFMTISSQEALLSDRAWLYLAFTIFVGLAFFLLSNLVKQGSDIEAIVRVVLIASSAIALFGIYQFVGDMAGLPSELTGIKFGYHKAVLGFTRIQSVALEPLFLANYLLLPIGLLSAYLILKQPFIDSFRATGLLLPLTFVFLMTLSRGGYIGLLAMFLVYLLLFAKQVFRPRVILSGLTVIFLVGAAVSAILDEVDPDAKERFINHSRINEIVAGGQSLFQRLDNAELAYNIFLSKPLFGVGPGNFGQAATNSLSEPREGGWPVVNNQYLEMLAETGLFGFLAFSLVLLTVLWRSFRAFLLAKDPFLKATALGFLGALIGTLFQWLTFSTIYILPVWILLGLTAGISGFILTNEGPAR